MSPNNNIFIEQTIYKFYHEDGRIVEKRKYDMKKEFDCKSIHKLISGERKTCRCWKYKGKIINLA